MNCGRMGSGLSKLARGRECLFFERLLLAFCVCETLYPVQPGKVLGQQRGLSEDNLSKEPQAFMSKCFPSDFLEVL